MMAAALWRALFGLLAGGVTAFVAGAPILIETVAGLALLGAFGSALHNALADTQEREPALIARHHVGSKHLWRGRRLLGLLAGVLVQFLVRAGASIGSGHPESK